MMSAVQDILLNFFCAFFGTIGFAVMFNVPKRFYISCGTTGAMGWIVYCLAVEHASAAVSSFFGALVVVLISRMLTIFMISGIFPLVPGAGVYYTAYYLVTGQLGEAAQRGIGAVKVAFAIVLGIVFIVSIPREFFQPLYWKKRWKLRKASKEA